MAGTEDTADGRISSETFLAEVRTPDWSVVGGRARAVFATGTFATGLRFVALVGERAEAAGHHPDLELGYPEVVVSLVTHDVGGLTTKDVRLAQEISTVAAGLGVQARAAGESAVPPSPPET
ncbi:4a-hydroxytetrahydrobiopterin dehydratase [Paraoerskovia marina]|uniref:4a-hydroxytetrahydrobiopterin dehydratase n=1 Tax=Paraoerskovia marina TaxID=545619 RepID=UPI000693662D|nr:4a-hydroxytetrahydrobiopterin dehydratase [Paraoerskovia marina]